MLKLGSLGSGSAGNAFIVQTDQSTVIVDSGFSARELCNRLSARGLSPNDVNAILVTHEHADHASGVVPFAEKFDKPVWCTHGTWSSARGFRALSKVNLIRDYCPFEIEDLIVTPFPVPHDAREPSQFVFSDGIKKFCILTDLGMSTPHVLQLLKGCHAIMLEFNHDVTMLRDSRYPMPLKSRIAGKFGHLSNDSAVSILRNVISDNLQLVIAGHLSDSNNDEKVVLQLLSGILDDKGVDYAIADQQYGSELIELH